MSRQKKNTSTQAQNEHIIDALATGVKTLARGVNALADVLGEQKTLSHGDGTSHTVQGLLEKQVELSTSSSTEEPGRISKKDPEAMTWEEIREEIEELRTAAMKRDKSQDQAGYWKMLYECLYEKHGIDVTQLKEDRNHNGSKITVLTHDELTKALDCAQTVY